MLHIAPRKIFILLCGTMLAGCAATAHTDVATGGDTQASHIRKEASAINTSTPTDLEGGVRQAQLMRLGGHYDDAIHVLSQLMLVASDDPRVVSEYGKTLAEKGRAQDAVEFLNRAIELASNDWTLYSALGVSYDQLGNQVSARAAYEHALVLRPEEASVLNNYALSRMLAGDTVGARILIGRAERAGGASDAKISSNIAMLNKVAPAPVAPHSVAVVDKSVATLVQPVAPIASVPVAGAQPVVMPQPKPEALAQNSPRSILPEQQQAQKEQAVAVESMPPIGGVVMQAVPFDPLAGPVKPVGHTRRVAATASAPLMPPKIDITSEPPTGPVELVGHTRRVAAAAPAALLAPKIDIMSEPPAAKLAPVKTASAKPSDVKVVSVKDAANDQIPALRMNANAY